MKRFILYALMVVLVLVCRPLVEMAEPSLQLLVGLIVASLILLICFITWHSQKRENDAKPIISVQAEVTGRRYNMEKRGKYHVRVHYLTFTTEDGSNLEFEVSELEFGRFEIGERGKLEYRGWEYLGLRRYDLGEMESVAEQENGIPTRRQEE